MSNGIGKPSATPTSSGGPSPGPATGNSPVAGAAAPALPDLPNAPAQWGRGLIAFASVVGVAIGATGIWLGSAGTVDGYVSLLLIMSGLAFFFGTVGAQAVVRSPASGIGPAFAIGGTAAVAIILFIIVVYFRTQAVVFINVIAPRDADLRLQTAANTIVRGSVSDAVAFKRFRFAVRYSELGEDEVYAISVDTTSAGGGEVCFPRGKIAMGVGRLLEVAWRIETGEEGRRLVAGGPNGAEVGSEQDCLARYGESATPGGFGIVTPAHAQVAPPSADQVDALILQALGNDTDLRRLAREALSSAGPSVIPRLMAEARERTETKDDLAFRAQLAAAVAVAGMLEPKRSIPPDDVRRALTSQDLVMIADWSQNDDASLRIPAAGILANAADIDTLRRVSELAAGNGNANVQFNSAWILERSLTRLGADAVAATAIRDFARTLSTRTLGPQTNAIIQRIVTQDR